VGGFRLFGNPLVGLVGALAKSHPNGTAPPLPTRPRGTPSGLQ
jgi:hypothetical protein